MCPDNDSEFVSRTTALIFADSSDKLIPPAPSPPASRDSASENEANGEGNTAAESTDREARFLDSLAGFARQRQEKSWSGTLATFLETIVRADPGACTRTSHQYIWDMLRAQGQEDKNGILRCSLLSNDLFGIDDSIGRVVDYFKAAAAGSEVGRRLLLLLGPPSGGKSTAVILLKRGMEEYSYTDAGALYAVAGCPVHESPLHLIPHALRAQFRETYGAEIGGELCPSCRTRVDQEFGGDFMRMPVERVFISEAGRVGVGTYAPHDPTTADLADLVGSVDLSKVAEFGDE